MIKNKKGFTLIELIIVMAIIGILAVVAIVAISGKSADARDARRMADMSAVQTGLALYCYERGNVGATTTVTTTVDGTVAAPATPLANFTATNLTNYITLAGINDPSNSGLTIDDGCQATQALDDFCNYSALVGDGNDSFDSCSYTIYALLEVPAVGADLMTVTEAGITRS